MRRSRIHPPPGMRCVQPDESRLRVAVAVRDPGHQLAMQLVACKAHQLVHLLEEDDLSGRVREPVGDVVAAEARSLFQPVSQAKERRQLLDERADAGVFGRADEDGACARSYLGALLRSVASTTSQSTRS